MPATPDPAAPLADAARLLRFGTDGPAYRLMQRLGVIRGDDPSVLRRSLAFLLVAWLPLLLLASWRGDALGATPRSSLLLDFATYARLFLAVPLVLAGEVVIGARLRDAGLHLLEGGFVRPESHAALHEAVARAWRRRQSLAAELLLLAIALAAPWYLTIDRLAGIGEHEPTWILAGGHLLPAGLWYHAVTLPLVQFIALRLLWHWVVWALFLRDVTRLQLHLLPTHADRAAGLGFLGMAHVPMAIFTVAVSSIIAAELGFRLWFEGLTLAGLQAMLPMLIGYLLAVEALVFGPLLVVVPLLAHTRRQALRRYGILVQRHNQLFHDKWIEGHRPAEESPLGSEDMASLIDLCEGFSVIRDMSVVPVSQRQLMQVAVITCLPGLPLLLLAVPIGDLARLLLGLMG